MTDTATTPAGWYADSEHPGGLRYWDGNAWTENRAPGTAPPTAQASNLAAPPIPAVVATKTKKPIFKRWYTWAGIVVLLIIIGSAMAPKGSTTASTGAATPDAQQSSAAAAPAAAGIGTAVRDGKFEFTIASVKCGATSVGTAPLTQKAQGQFCLVNVTAKNIGTEAQTFFDANQTVYDTQGRQFKADSAAALYANPTDTQVFITEINPGNQIQGVMVFDVPKGAVLDKIQLHDSALSGGVDVSLK